LIAVFGAQGVELGVAEVLHLFDVLAEGGDGDGDAVDEGELYEGDKLGGAVADDEVFGVDV
jgi:2-polyprenyl-6-methoxyphenol hydroxylase-like FAD-dependent oxidoreductase